MFLRMRNNNTEILGRGDFFGLVSLCLTNRVAGGGRPPPALTPPGMPARHQGGFSRTCDSQFLPPAFQLNKSYFFEPPQIHTLVDLGTAAQSPQAFAAQCHQPRRPFRYPLTLEKFCDRIGSLELFESNDSELSADPMIEVPQGACATAMAKVGYPARGELVQLRDFIAQFPRAVPAGQLSNPGFKTADTLGGNPKLTVLERGGSPETIARLPGLPPISPRLRAASAFAR